LAKAKATHLTIATGKP